MRIGSVGQSLRRLGIGVACLLLLGCPNAPERARLEAIHSFEAMIPGLVRELRDALIPEARGEPVGEKAALPTRYLKNLDYRVEPTAVQTFPFLGSLHIEYGGGVARHPGRETGAGEHRYLVSLDFVEKNGNWRIYYSRILSPMGYPQTAGSSELSQRIEDVLGPWRMVTTRSPESTFGLTHSRTPNKIERGGYLTFNAVKAPNS